MSFDLAASLRRLKPQQRLASVARRPDAALPFVDAAALAGPPLLLDTNVYIDLLQDRAPPAVVDLLAVRQLNHSAIALAELAHPFGRLDPAHPGTAAALRGLAAVIERIPLHRLAPAGTAVMAEAGIVAGTLARLRGLAPTDRQPLLNDAALFLQAREAGLTLLSANIVDMDAIAQLVPDGRYLLYRRLP